ncbi:ion transporter [Halomonas sp. Bachu 37]|uniref:ion transporter n=1 Tax=Halomonas kashgarensis TaxID=3084920 RepID=UPI00321783DD
MNRPACQGDAAIETPNDTIRPHRRTKRDLPPGLERLHLVWDLFIMAAVVINLSFLLFDSLYLLPPLNSAFEQVAPGLHGWYETHIHANFTAIDLSFVALFVMDVLLGWLVAIIERRYHRWFFYPFVHWYDVLGCIPVSGFRLLRVLRVVSLLYRLQRLGLIHVQTWAAYAFLAKYYDILLEELSDRIALRLLGNVQEQVQSSDSLTERVIERVVMPRKQQLVKEIAERLEEMAGGTYQRNREDIRAYINQLIGRTLQESPEIQRLRRLPMGHQLTQAMNASLSGVAWRLVDEMALGINSPEFGKLVEKVAGNGFDTWLRVDERSDHVTEQVLIDALEMIKDQIRRQRWKDRYD